jgi:hypothetical protein
MWRSGDQLCTRMQEYVHCVCTNFVVLILGGGVRLKLPWYLSPLFQPRMKEWSIDRMIIVRVKPKYRRKTCPSATSSTTPHMDYVGLNLGVRDETG